MLYVMFLNPEPPVSFYHISTYSAYNNFSDSRQIKFLNLLFVSNILKYISISCVLVVTTNLMYEPLLTAVITSNVKYIEHSCHTIDI